MSISHNQGYFDESYYQGGTKSPYSDYMLQSEVFDTYWIPLINRYTKHLIPGGRRSLDIGCGYGFLVKKYSSQGWESFGIDISEYAIRRGKELGIENIGVGSSSELPFDDNYFDLVTCLDVLEHLDEETFIKTRDELYRVLRKGGMAFIAIPNRIENCNWNIFSDNYVEEDESHINYKSANEMYKIYSNFTRVIVTGGTPFVEQFRAFKWQAYLPKMSAFKGLNRTLNSWLRHFLWKYQGSDVRYSAYIYTIAIK